MKLSIIVPVYNVEAYIEKCIHSLQHQDIPTDEYEVIVVNDGSPDNCREIVMHLQQEYKNIILIDQENQGVSMARNNAMARATGEYILPIDPDDFVILNSFKHILDKAEASKLDVLFLGFEIFDEAGTKNWETDYTNLSGKIYPGAEAYFAARGDNVRDPDRSWAILYKRTLLERFNISYPKDVPYLEDGLFLAKVFAVADRCGFDNYSFYQRTTRSGSATHSHLFYTENALNGFLKAAADIRDFRQRNTLSVQQSNLVNHVIAKFVLLPVISCVGAKDWQTFKKIKPVIINAGFRQLDLTGCRSVYQQYGWHFNLSKNWFFFYYTCQSLLISIKFRITRFKPAASKTG